tara:strand:+ start:3922 stop:4212 length:291 start_codon:yes stop_codon:yes gene_type:complete
MSEPEKTIEDAESTLLLFSGLEDAFMGCVETYGKPPVACYSKLITIKTLIANYNISEKEARDKYEYEYLQSNFGEATPCFLDDEPPKENVSGENLT